ncbi:MAG TPA: flagellar biosynthesis protein FlhF [Tepidisphaeraceae bacterium]|jgi:flagellar biosynthesis protein FlhF
MDLQTFKAPTMAEALGQVKSALGNDAIILHTRTYYLRRWLGLRKREVVEITAGRGLNIGSRGRRSAPVMRNVDASVNRAPTTAVTVREPAHAIGRSVVETPAASNTLMTGLATEMESLKGLVKELVVQVRQQKVPQIPEELFEHYLTLVQSDVAEDLATDIIKAVHRQLRPEHLSQPQFVREKLAEELEQMLQTSGPIVRTKTTGPHVVALIGPTGVGKTTTIAKLAANLKLREKNKVGLITIDTYRIAAIDQLKKYADILGSPLRVVSSPEDMRNAVASMSECEFILIDTAGRSPNDTMKLSELKTFLAAAGPDEVHLVTSTTSNQATIELALTKFGELDVSKLIFTKLDEAAKVGAVLNILSKVNKPLSYITTGQDVPDDIEVAQGRRLAELILNGSLRA